MPTRPCNFTDVGAAFFGCHEPLPPGTRCGELREGLSSREPGVVCNLSL